MMECWISLFIDDELNLDEKIGFVEKIHADKAFKDESVSLLRQEKLVRSEVVDQVPVFDATQVEASSEKQQPAQRHFLQSFGFFFRPLGLMASALAVLALFMFANMPSERSKATTLNRFIIYQPDISRVELSGTFTSWKRIPMTRVGASGYWEANFNLQAGEHRYIYILDGQQRVADPTVQAREKDDFGGENSILFVETSI
jgi:Glycogen recognition site of AMP-activated protein kinase